MLFRSLLSRREQTTGNSREAMLNPKQVVSHLTEQQEAAGAAEGEEARRPSKKEQLFAHASVTITVCIRSQTLVLVRDGMVVTSRRHMSIKKILFLLRAGLRVIKIKRIIRPLNNRMEKLNACHIKRHVTLSNRMKERDSLCVMCPAK